MAAPARPPRGTAIAKERAVAVGGDIVDSVIVTGDNVNIRLAVGSEHGALLERLARSQLPRKVSAPAPLSGGPPPFEDHLDRRAESEALVRAEGGSPANIYGDAGVGKTYVLAAALAPQAPVRSPIGLSTCLERTSAFPICCRSCSSRSTNASRPTSRARRRSDAT